MFATFLPCRLMSPRIDALCAMAPITFGISPLTDAKVFFVPSV